MKLEVGMYVRDIKGRIDKIIDFKGALIEFEQDLMVGYIDCNDFIKASYNIIDILEKGDYVNGSKVLGFENEYIEEDGKYVPFGVITENCYLDNNKSWIIEKEIKLVVTKEQMEQMAYKVGE